MSTRGRFLRGVALLSIAASAIFGLVACGTGDDNAAPTPLIDSGLQVGTLGDGNPGILCLDGGDDAGDATLTPYTACSPYSAGCIPFDPARVPIHPSL
jgi:hypothetical protein